MTMAMASAQRAAVIAEAMRWIGTPYRHEAMIFGVGVDCAMLAVACYRAAGVIDPAYDPRPYPVQWHLHHSEERYIEQVLQYADEVSTPQHGDLGIWQYGHTFSHGGILIEDDAVIHAFHGRPVGINRLDDATFRGPRGPRAVRWYSPRGMK